jgi:hypothetical protein
VRKRSATDERERQGVWRNRCIAPGTPHPLLFL